MTTQAQFPTDEPAPGRLKRPLMTRGQVARRLGTSPSAVDKMEERGDLPPREKDAEGTTYFDPDDVDKIEEQMGLRRVAQESPANVTENNRLAVQMMAQLMAHADKATKNALATNDHLLRANERYQDRIQKLEAELDNAADSMRELGDDKHQKHLEALKAGSEQERKDKGLTFILEKFATLWPIVQVKLFGLPVGKQEHPAWSALERFLQTLTTEQMQALLGTLNSDQTALFKTLVELLTTTPEKKEEKPAADAEKKS